MRFRLNCEMPGPNGPFRTSTCASSRPWLRGWGSTTTPMGVPKGFQKRCRWLRVASITTTRSPSFAARTVAMTWRPSGVTARPFGAAPTGTGRLASIVPASMAVTVLLPELPT